jgi:hypothetical protein
MSSHTPPTKLQINTNSFQNMQGNNNSIQGKNKLCMDIAFSCVKTLHFSKVCSSSMSSLPPSVKNFFQKIS